MSPEAQRIAIADVCGWKPRTLCVPYLDENGEESGTSVIEETMPDYLNDLNAMHEAENTLSDNDAVVYAANLTRGHDIWDVMPNDEHFTCCYGALHATAAQRAEAFLRTLGKWVPDE